MKLWNKGVRLFKGLGRCIVYHFSSVSKIRKKMLGIMELKYFYLKWGMRIKFFKNIILNPILHLKVS